MKYDVLLINYTGSDLFKEISRIKNVYQEKPFELNVSFPGALAHIGTKLRKAGFTCDYITSFVDYKDDLQIKLQNHEYDFVGISTTHITDLETIREIASFVRSYNRDCKIIVGGPFVVAKAKQFSDIERQLLYKRLGADLYMNSNVGGDRFISIIDAYRGNGDMNQIVNITYKNGNRFIQTESRQEYELLSDCEIDWSYFTDYNIKIVPVRASVSCPYSCKFCAYPIHSGKYQIRDLEEVERELDQIHSIGKTEIVHFIDDSLNIPPDRFIDLLQILKKKNYGFKWFSYVRCQFITDEIAKLMKETGCFAVILGLESGNQQVLDNMDKRVKVSELKRGIKALKNNGIATMGFFFVGFPGETVQSVYDTIDLIENDGPDFYAVVPWYFDVTTPIAKEKDKYDLKGNNYQWSHSTMDYETAVKLCDEFPKNIKNSAIKTIQTHHVFELIAQGFKIEEVKSILRSIGNEVRLGRNLHKN